MVQATTTVFEKDGKFTIKAIGITTKYLTPEEVANIHKYSVNKNIIYRHVNASKDGKGEIIGTVTKAEMVDVTDKDGGKHRGIELEADLMGYTKNQQDALEYIKLKQESGDPVKLSIGTQTFTTSDGTPVDSRPYEYSLTDIPVCKECKIVDIQMTDEDEARISELKSSLDKAAGLNKDYMTTITNLESKISEFESKEEEAAKKVDAVNKSFEDKLQEKIEAVNKVYEEKYQATAKALEAVTQELELAKKSPVIAEIFELEKDEMARDGWYTTMNLEDLTKRLEYVKNITPAVKPFVRGQADSASTDTRVEKYKASVSKALEDADPMLAKILKGHELSAGERQKLRGY